MAWNTPTHSCGHEGERIQLYGPHAQREAKLEAMGRQECPACRAAKARSEAQSAGLPALVGSEKQVAWASDIRKGLIPREETVLAALRAAPSAENQALRDVAISAAERVLEGMRSQASARWWIDHRGGGVVMAAVHEVAQAAQAL
jgi:hypothetical protein